MLGDVSGDGINEFGNATEHTATQPLVIKIAEEPLDDIEPRTAGGDEVYVEAFMSLQPGLDFRVLVRCVIIDNEMKIKIRRCFRIDLFEELDPLLMPMSCHALSKDFSLRHLDGGEQCRGSVSLVVVGHRPATTGNHRQTRLGSIKRLHRTLFISADHQRLLRGVEVEADHIDQLLFKVRISTYLECAHQMWLQTIGLPHAMNHGLTDPECRRKRSGTPMRCVSRRLLRGLANDFAFDAFTHPA